MKCRVRVGTARKMRFLMPGPSRVALRYLREWRLHRHLSQADLGRRADVAETTIARAEKGGKLMNVLTATKLAHALGASVADLESMPPDPYGRERNLPDLPWPGAPPTRKKPEEEAET
jgi:transcriptional regulator with XRE-family HTH domain